jgi:hypothetical protein
LNPWLKQLSTQVEEAEADLEKASAHITALWSDPGIDPPEKLMTQLADFHMKASTFQHRFEAAADACAYSVEGLLAEIAKPSGGCSREGGAVIFMYPCLFCMDNH